MKTSDDRRRLKRSKLLVGTLMLGAIFMQTPTASSLFNDAREHLLRWSVEKVISAAARELQSRFQ